ncbi:hypothetical protein [Methanoculleus taiwanensis]|uniref:hypothetical protein n=1 Tax=Methanoculleus taiwanensis TaxID=1550565 RepID=UPI000FFF48DD|nr:hypothetical protein [Methanoculleus taiwanensis]
MGFTRDATYLDVMKALSKQYAPREGWEFEWRPDYGAVQPECVITRREKGQTKRVLVGVKMEKAIPASALEQLASQTRSLAGQKKPVDRAVLVVPTGAEVPATAEGIDIVRLDSYKVLGNRIAWTKNLERSEAVEAERQQKGLA